MGAFDVENYEIWTRLPEWWKDDLFLTVVNHYSSVVIRDVLKEFLPYMAVMQPWMLWKYLPEEVNWKHEYVPYKDDWIKQNKGLTLQEDNPIVVGFPNTKRDCDVIIDLELHPYHRDMDGLKSFDINIYKIKTLKITNANQELLIHDIDTKSHIVIDTKEEKVLIDDEDVIGQRSYVDGRYVDRVEGNLKKIKPVQRDEETDNVLDENKKTELQIDIEYFKNNADCVCDLNVELLRPVYVTEQNVRLWTPSAFPLRRVRLFGYFCHEFNSNEGWSELYVKTYSSLERVTYDMITTEFDCEIFYAIIEYYGIEYPIAIGFPQEEYSVLNTNYNNELIDVTFDTNKVLDHWGKIFNMPRRYYRTDITVEEERYTYPRYYRYDIEQDYWYEKRLLNEYKENYDAINGCFISDTDGNNLAYVEVTDPYIEDLYLYTETVPSTEKLTTSTGPVQPTNKINIKTNKTLSQKEWKNINALTSQSDDSYAEIELNPYKEDYIAERSFETETIILPFQVPRIPQNTEITGMEIKFHGKHDIYSNHLTLTEDSYVNIANKYSEMYVHQDSDIEYVQLNIGDEYVEWERGKSTYTIGDKNHVFNYPNEKISNNQLQQIIYLHLGFQNLDPINKAKFKVNKITLTVYYKFVEEKYKASMYISNTPSVNEPNLDEAEKVYCYNIVDGDTIDVRDSKNKTYRVRLVGVNCPEIPHTLADEVEAETDEKVREEYERGRLAMDFTYEKCYQKYLYIDKDTDDDGNVRTTYGRTLAVVYYPYRDGYMNLNKSLLNEDHAEIMYIPPSKFYPYSWERWWNGESQKIVDIYVKNNGDVNINNKRLFLVLPPEIEYYDTSTNIWIHSDGPIIIQLPKTFNKGENLSIHVPIRYSQTGVYDISLICDKEIITKTIRHTTGVINDECD